MKDDKEILDLKPTNKKDDGEPSFIKKDDKEQTAAQKRDSVFQDLESLLKGALAKLEGVRPEGNQQRNLDRETGGVEAEKDKGTSDEDTWDKRSDEIKKMIHDEQDLNHSSKSSRDQSFIHAQKQRKKHEKAKDGAESNLSYVQQVNRLRKAKIDKSDFSVENKGGREI